MTGKPFQTFWILLGGVYKSLDYHLMEMKYWLQGQEEGQGLPLKSLLQAMVMDPRHWSSTPGSIRCSGRQTGAEMNRNSQTWVNRHLGRTTGCFLPESPGGGES